MAESKTAAAAAGPQVAPGLPSTYRAIQIAAKGELKLVTVPLRLPSAREVLVKVISCGLCHSDVLAVQKLFPGPDNLVPGHEVIGVVVAVGSEVTRFKIGERVGRGWHGGNCFQCDSCLRGDFFACNSTVPTGVGQDGGYAEYMVAPYSSLARVPAGLSLREAGPLCCAGITCFNALRNTGARAGDVVAVQGLGGLGHLGVQFARQMGFRTVAISTSAEKKEAAKKLGATDYIDTSSQDLGKELKAMGGARAIITTAFDSKAQASLVPGLGTNGELLLLGVDPAQPFVTNGMALLGNRGSVKGWYSGTAIDAQDTMEFAHRTGVKTQCEFFPFEKFQEAYDRMLSGKARFRVVLDVSREADAPAAPAPAATAAAHSH